MAEIMRYDKYRLVGSNLNPLEDVLFWIRGLRSKGYVENILKEQHNIRGVGNVNKRTVAINRHADMAVNLLEQGFNSSVETSFLPLYYGLSNLSKIYIICSKYFSELYLKKNRHHGAIAKPLIRGSELLKDKVEVIQRGTIPLLYKTITDLPLDKNNMIRLEEIFPFIQNVSHEHSLISKKDMPLQNCDLAIKEDEQTGYYIELSLKSPFVKNSEHSGCNKFLKEFVKIADKKYRTETITGNSEIVEKQLKKKIKRFLLYEYGVPLLNNVETMLPISGKRILLPEELPILLAFFHLSNIVRYHPELLLNMKNSPEWGMIQSLSRHGAYRFLILFWSYLYQESFFVHSS